ncbi:MAG: 1,4-dihydroxy-2-naphthoate octaprenyltransferase, partial [Steroidobacteraceae bacterium]
MIKEAVSPLEPRYEDLAGDGLSRKARRLFLATRPKFLTASILPVLVGTAWGATVAGGLEVGVALLALLATALVHCASNVINDVGDEITGTDRDNVDRIYPYTGGSRFIQNRIMSPGEMHRWAWMLFGIAAVLGLVLAVLKGPWVIALGIGGIAIAVLYSTPSVQLSGKGVGEAFLMVAFGVLPVCGAAWLQSSIIDLDSVLIALPVGIWVTLILLINEVPDRKADGANGKRTLVVRLGVDGARHLYRVSHVIALASIVLLVTRG